ncbi:MAG: hypothetical protein GVY28_07230, partial [Alphaproteobacteria bacterium]|nr:hypothetical protein [Alphaproteobacteria bacterium]
MKPTYLAAALAAAVSLSGTAQAAFTGTITKLADPTTDLPDPVSPSDTAGIVLDPAQGTDLNDGANSRKSPYRTSSGGPFAGLQADSSFLSVQENSSATFDISGPVLRILWGSPDTTGDDGNPPGSPDSSRNFIQFLSGGSVFATVTAKDLEDSGEFGGTAKFDPAADGFAYADIDPDGGKFDRIKVVNS